MGCSFSLICSRRKLSLDVYCSDIPPVTDVTATEKVQQQMLASLQFIHSRNAALNTGGATQYLFSLKHAEHRFVFAQQMV